ncbi:MAG: DUF4249 domain-containing protein [Flavobacteriales bacterium]|nr:DUF4249 domain-containing protein [Flavobacteriales bacterium]
MPKVCLATIFVICFSFFSCEKEIPIDVEESEPKIAVNGVFKQDSLWSIQVSKSKHLLDTSQYAWVDNANVKIVSDQGNEIDLSYFTNGIYRSLTAFPKLNERYTLRIETDGFPLIETSAALPTPIEISKIDTGSVSVEGEILKNISIGLNDPEDENYYNITFISRYTQYESIWDDQGNQIVLDSTLGYETILDMHTTDFDLQNSQGEDVFEKGWYFGDQGLNFTDLNFNGRETTLDINLSMWHFSNDTSYASNFKKEMIYVILSSISKELYLYKESLNKYWNTVDNPFAQPVQVYSNIENGIGVFAGQSYVIDSIAVE